MRRKASTPTRTRHGCSASSQPTRARSTRCFRPRPTSRTSLHRSEIPSQRVQAMITLQQLEQHDEFLARHVGPNDDEIVQMLAAIGQPSLDALVTAIVPGSIRLDRPLALGAPVTEEEALAKITALARKNQVFRSFIGMGYHGT